jgi:hypothetical protein
LRRARAGGTGRPEVQRYGRVRFTAQDVAEADGRASVKRVTIEELEVKRLKVTGLEVAGEQRPMV